MSNNHSNRRCESNECLTFRRLTTLATRVLLRTWNRILKVSRIPLTRYTAVSCSNTCTHYRCFRSTHFLQHPEELFTFQRAFQHIHLSASLLFLLRSLFLFIFLFRTHTLLVLFFLLLCRSLTFSRYIHIYSVVLTTNTLFLLVKCVVTSSADAVCCALSNGGAIIVIVYVYALRYKSI